MPKGYLVAHITINDREGYDKYLALAAIAIEKYGARPIIRGGRFQELEGTCRSRTVVMEFPSFDDAMSYYHSPEYRKAKCERLLAAETDLIAIEGS